MGEVEIRSVRLSHTKKENKRNEKKKMKKKVTVITF